MRNLVLIVGALHLASGLFMALDPREFYETVGTFPPFNEHYVRDLATWYLAFGAVLIAAADRPAWQRPLLTLALAQYGLHVINHIVDVGEPTPSWMGPATVAFLVLVGAVVTWMLRRASADRTP